MAEIISIHGLTEQLLRWRRAVRISGIRCIKNYEELLGVQSIAGHGYVSTLKNTPQNIAKFILASRHNKLILSPERDALIVTIGKEINCTVDDRDYIKELEAAMDDLRASGAEPNYIASDFRRIDPGCANYYHF